MGQDGKREGAGRKRIGVIINTRVDKGLIERIEKEIEGRSRAEKIRKCLEKGLENTKD